MRKKRIATVIAASMGAFALLSTQAFAITWETDVATATSSSSGGPWTWLKTDDVGAAFAAAGDWFFISDNRADGMSADVQWQLKNSSGTLVRGGSIWMKEGAGDSRYKNKDFTEGYKLTWRVCRGKGTWVEHCSSYKTQTA
ncbi:hypothetical protein [Streptomyces sp. NPDC056921]|uniref:hypothetical protein n=1 Tax=Streptomyces sp. NPDC056921 TaxID=3345966 RepID=UPI0036282878